LFKHTLDVMGATAQAVGVVDEMGNEAVNAGIEVGLAD
jgi:hypothetical protein